MIRTLLKSKIHRATVTDADVAYEGSISVDSELLAAADILPYESVDIWDATNGARLRTYAIPAPPGSGQICINGAAAHLVKPHDIIIIASFVQLPDEAARRFEPIRIFVDPTNRIRS